MIAGIDRSLVTGTWDEDTKTMQFLVKGIDQKTTYKGIHRFVRDDYAEASGTITNASGDVVLELSWKQTRRKESSKAASATVTDLVARNLKAIGGVEAHKKLKTRRTEGTMTIAAIGAAWKLTVTQKAPDLSYSSTEIPGLGTVLEGYDGKVAWRKTPGQGTAQITGEEFKQERRDAFFYGNIELESQYKTLTDGGRKTVKGKEYRVLVGTYDDGTRHSIYLDPKTYLIGLIKRPFVVTKFSGVIDGTIEFSDYREVDGVRMAFCMVISLPETDLTITMKFDKVKHGVKVDDALFAVPTD